MFHHIIFLPWIINYHLSLTTKPILSLLSDWDWDWRWIIHPSGHSHFFSRLTWLYRVRVFFVSHPDRVEECICVPLLFFLWLELSTVLPVSTMLYSVSILTSTSTYSLHSYFCIFLHSLQPLLCVWQKRKHILTLMSLSMSLSMCFVQKSLAVWIDKHWETVFKPLKFLLQILTLHAVKLVLCHCTMQVALSHFVTVWPISLIVLMTKWPPFHVPFMIV